ncbi:MAG TPA: hypothetical protein VIV60_05675 [Polyangiaceae bacterium]
MRTEALLVISCAAILGGCTVGEGEGSVTSERLVVRDCWDGPFDLGPTFFAANAFDRDQLAIRVQRGDNNQEVSDGLSVVIRDLQPIRADSIGKPVKVGIPPGVHPPGTAWTVSEEPAVVSLTLYLHDTCFLQNGALYSIDGEITFAHLFSGDPNERVGDQRLTDAKFESVRFADPRNQNLDGTYDADKVSEVSGWFRFYFQRGQPAQPFP